MVERRNVVMGPKGHGKKCPPWSAEGERVRVVPCNPDPCPASCTESSLEFQEMVKDSNSKLLVFKDVPRPGVRAIEAEAAADQNDPNDQSEENEETQNETSTKESDEESQEAQEAQESEDQADIGEGEDDSKVDDDARLLIFCFYLFFFVFLNVPQGVLHRCWVCWFIQDATQSLLWRSCN